MARNEEIIIGHEETLEVIAMVEHIAQVSQNWGLSAEESDEVIVSLFAQLVVENNY